VNAHWSIHPLRPADLAAWARLRGELWTDANADELAAETRDFLAAPGDSTVFVALLADSVVGFAEATLRRDYVNGTDASPVGFLEGWYVAPAQRGGGIGRALVDAVERWTREHGCAQLASDALIGNTASQRAHLACGFRETERVVCFVKSVAADVGA